MSRLRDFIEKNEYIKWLLIIFIIHCIAYFSIQRLDGDIHMIETWVDYKIPFVEAFVIPYVFWYVYVVGVIIMAIISSKDDFIKLMIYFFLGDFVSLIIYAVYPTGIAFRPETFVNNNFFTYVVGLIYAADAPVNVCPSLHCYVSMVMNMCVCRCQLVNNSRYRTWIKIISSVIMVLICLSTVFIKQHSIIDFVASLCLAIIIYPVAYIWNYRESRIINTLFSQKK